MQHRFSVMQLEPADRFVFGALQIIVLLSVLGYFVLVVYRYLIFGIVGSGDFAFFWTAGQILSAQDLQSAYSGDLFSIQAAQQRWQGLQVESYLAYPPHFPIYFWLFGQLPYPVAFFAWQFLSLALLTLAAWSAFGRCWWAARFTVLAPATFICLWAAQTGLFGSALLIAGMGFLGRRPILAGVLIGLLTFKPTLGLLIPFAIMARGHWSAFISAVVTAGTLIFVSLLVYGVEAWTTYFVSMPDTIMNIQATRDGLFVSLVPTVFMAFRLLGFDSAVGFGAQALVAVVVLICVVWVFRNRGDSDLSTATLFAGTALALPYIHSYDMPFVAAAVFLLLRDMATKGDYVGERSIAVCVWALPLLIFVLNSAQIPIGPLVLALFFGVLMRRLIRETRQGRNPLPESG